MENAHPLRVLFVEDIPSDAILAEREIRKSGLEFSSQRVDTKDAFLKAQGEFAPDIIVSDYSMPEFDGMQALKLSLEHDYLIPFVLLTGSVNEETAVACMKAGATDYVLKERLARLPFAVRDALEQKKMRTAKDEAERALRESEARYRSVLESANDAIVTAESEGLISGWNHGAERIFGYRYTEIIGESLTHLMPQFYRDAHSEPLSKQKSRGLSTMIGKTSELEGVRKDGSIFHMELSLSAWEVGGGQYYTGIIRDITDRKQVEDALANSEKKFKWLFEYAPVAYHVLTPDGTITDVNVRWCETLGYSRDEVIGKSIFDFILPSERPISEATFEAKKKAVSAVKTRNERTYVAKDGSARAFIVADFMTVDGRGGITSIQTTMEDITERKRAEEALRTSESQLSSAMTMAHLGHWEYDVATDLFTFNDQFYAMFRTTAAQVGGYTMSSSQYAQRFVHPDDMPLVGVETRKALESNDPHYSVPLEHRIIYADGEAGYITVRIFLVKDEQGRTIKTYGVNQDITERKQAELSLRLSEERFRSVWDNSADGMRLIDRDGTIIAVNDAYCRLVNLPRERLVGKVFSVAYARGGPDDDITIYRKRFDSKEIVSHLLAPVTLWDGRVLELDISNSFTQTEGAERLVLSIFRDVTELQRTNAALEKERTLLSALIESIPDEICMKDNAHRFVVANSAVARALGAGSAADLLGKTDFDFMRPELAQTHFDEEDAIMASGHSIINLERTSRSPLTGETEKCLLTTKVPVRNKDGQKIGILVVNRYITERKKAEEALRASEEKFRALFEESKDVVYIGTADGNLLDINAAGVQLFGYDSKEDLLRLDLRMESYVDPSERERFRREIEKAGFVKDFELTLKTKSGDTLTVLETATAVRDKLGNVVMHRGIIRDVTKQRLLERQFLQAQKMESIGTLAGGIAHDFNNILGIILGHLALLERTRNIDTQFEESIFSISKAVDRGASLVRQILTFAHRTDTQLEPVSINAMIKELVKMLEETFPKTMSMTLHLDKAVPAISLDPSQLHQALLNICVNARDAMNGQGTLTLATRLVTGQDVAQQFPEARGSHYLRVSVVDNGVGMDEETKRRMFEPFFTTKEKGKGTGLGLAVVYGVLQAHQGFIDVVSSKGAGSAFHLFFPVPEGILPPATERSVLPTDLPRGTETILVVEDEDILRDLLVRLLEMQGYRVISASDGDEAVKRYDEHVDEIDLVLSDMGLPKRNGWEAVKAMQGIRTSVRALLASGYLDPGQKSEVLKSGIKGFIQKPYKMEDVLKAIRDTLDAEDSTSSIV